MGHARGFGEKPALADPGRALHDDGAATARPERIEERCQSSRLVLPTQERRCHRRSSGGRHRRLAWLSGRAGIRNLRGTCESSETAGHPLPPIAEQYRALRGP